jgi:hypothetical protein
MRGNSRGGGRVYHREKREEEEPGCETTVRDHPNWTK